MINLKTKEFKAKLEKAIEKLDCAVGIYQVGSSVYLDNYNDIDLIVLVSRPRFFYNWFEYKGHRVNIQSLTKTAFENPFDLYSAEKHDIVCIWGEDKLERIDFLAYPQYHETMKNMFEHIIKKNPKRKWNYLLFQFKIANKSHELTKEQIAELQKAHDCVEDLEREIEVYE